MSDDAQTPTTIESLILETLHVITASVCPEQINLIAALKKAGAGTEIVKADIATDEIKVKEIANKIAEVIK